jgi:type IX secretion system PorP/SprF family membrane protein
MRMFFVLLCFVLWTVPLLGQDIQYSQFYASPLYLNPAMTGAEENTRVGLNYRNQWPGLTHSFSAYSAYVDHFIEGRNSGVGLLINGSTESLAQLSNMEIGALYAYRLRLNEYQFLNFGGQLSYVSRSAGFEDLVFGSQIDVDRGTIDATQPYLPTDGGHHHYADLNVGLLWNSRNLWLGLSAHHLSKPHLSYLHDGNGRLPIKYGVHGGLRLDLTGGFINDYFNNTLQERAVFFAFNYKNQEPFHQLDIGGQVFFEPLVLGLWYRGLPIKYGLPNSESLIMLVGLALQSGMDVGYSFDLTTSKLGLKHSGGAHEVSVRYSFYRGDPYKRDFKLLPFF